jgi:hypothetical protein
MPEVRSLESRRLLAASAAASATMTQTATFPDLESHPTLSDQALLYFCSTMGTLTEVDLVTSGSFQTQFSAENQGSTGCTIAGTTSGNLTINVPTGAVPVIIPPVTETFNASAFDGKSDYGGTSGKTFAPVTSSSTPQTLVLTSPADLAAFTGHFRIPISVSGHATGSVAADTSNLSTAFQTNTSATITVIHHYIPNLPSREPPAASPPASAGGGTSAVPISATGTVPGTGGGPAASALPEVSSSQTAKHHAASIRIASAHHQHPRPVALARHLPTHVALGPHHGPSRPVHRPR